jgi:DNA-binding transcriptional LysR family regulator
LVPLVLREVRQDLPHVRLRILEGSNGQLDEWLNSGRLDVAVLYRYSSALSSNEESLCTIDSWLVGPIGDRLTRNATVPFNKLHQLPLVLPSSPNGLRAALSHAAQRLQITLNVAVEVDSIPIQKDLARGGFGYAVLGLHAVGRELKAGELQAARLAQPGVDRSVTLATSTRHPLSLAGKSVTALLRKHVIQTVAQAAPKTVKQNIDADR